MHRSRVSLQNFIFDMDPLPYTALQIDGVDASSVSATVLPAHPTLELLYSAHTLNRRIAAVYSSGSSRLDGLPSTKRGLPEVITWSNWSRLPSGGYRVPVAWGGQRPPTQGLQAGDLLVFDPRIYAGFQAPLVEYEGRSE